MSCCGGNCAGCPGGGCAGCGGGALTLHPAEIDILRELAVCPFLPVGLNSRTGEPVCREFPGLDECRRSKSAALSASITIFPSPASITQATTAASAAEASPSPHAVRRSLRASRCRASANEPRKNPSALCGLLTKRKENYDYAS